MNNLLHIYAQPFGHQEAWIVGDKDALVALRDAITSAIDNEVGAAHTYCADGEGYIAIVLNLEASPKWNLLELPYNQDGVISPARLAPYKLLNKSQYKEIYGKMVSE